MRQCAVPLEAQGGAVSRPERCFSLRCEAAVCHLTVPEKGETRKSKELRVSRKIRSSDVSRRKYSPSCLTKKDILSIVTLLGIFNIKTRTRDAALAFGVLWYLGYCEYPTIGRFGGPKTDPTKTWYPGPQTVPLVVTIIIPARGPTNTTRNLNLGRAPSRLGGFPSS